MKELPILTTFYETHDEDSRFSTHHGSVEYLTTLRYIEQYLKPGAQILEVGAGTGRYSIELARRGYDVEAIELVEHNIARFRANIPEGVSVRVRQGNAIDLGAFPDQTFDITLVLGPMYHLFDPDDKRRAIHEALRVTKSGGAVFFAYCMSDATIVDWGFQRGNIQKALHDGIVEKGTFRTLSRPELVFELYRREDIDALMAGLPVTREHYVATDLFTRYMDSTLDALDEEMFSLYLAYHFSVCERSDFVGITHHSLDILRKK